MIDRKTMMWDFLKTIINLPIDTNGMVFMACSDSDDAYEKYKAVLDISTKEPGVIKSNTIKFGEVLFTRCDKFFVHSGETRNAIYGSDITGRTSPCFTCLSAETVSLISNSSSKKPMYALIISLKQSSLLPAATADITELYCSEQIWFAMCSSTEVISFYSANMLKYGVMAECVWIKHKLCRTMTADMKDPMGNYDMVYGTSTPAPKL